MKIQVTQAHIERGLRKSQNNCPIALAVAEATGWDDFDVKADCVFVGVTSIEIPEDAELSIDAFDDGLPVQPFEFELEVPA